MCPARAAPLPVARSARRRSDGQREVRLRTQMEAKKVRGQGRQGVELELTLA